MTIASVFLSPLEILEVYSIIELEDSVTLAEAVPVSKTAQVTPSSFHTSRRVGSTRVLWWMGAATCRISGDVKSTGEMQ